MGRGGGRGKASSNTFGKDVVDPRMINTWTNITLFEFLQEGCFERDVLSYCSNRLSDYSCIYWFDKDTARSARQQKWKNDRLAHVDQQNWAKSTPTSNTNDCFYEYSVQEAMPFASVPIQGILFLILAHSILANIFTLITMRRLCLDVLPLCGYVYLIAQMELLDQLLRLVDFTADMFTLRVGSATQMLGRASCQIFTAALSFFKHLLSGFLLGLSVDLWRILRNPKEMLMCYRYEWLRNVIILNCAIYVTLNCQFFWTFDVTEDDNFSIHEFTLTRIYECGFSKEWPLSRTFVNYVWPLVDHLGGEILPILFCGAFGIINMKLLRNGVLPSTEILAQSLLYVDTQVQCLHVFTRLLIMEALCYLPELAFYVMKYYFFAITSQYKHQSMTPDALKQIQTNSWVPAFQPYRHTLELLELWLRALRYAVPILRFLLLATNVTAVRTACLFYLQRLFNIRNWSTSRSTVTAQSMTSNSTKFRRYKMDNRNYAYSDGML